MTRGDATARDLIRLPLLLSERFALPTYRSLGLMSGTSMDGVDVALIETDGDATVVFGPTGHYPYSDADRALPRNALAEAATLRP